MTHFNAYLQFDAAIPDTCSKELTGMCLVSAIDEATDVFSTQVDARNITMLTPLGIVWCDWFVKAVLVMKCSILQRFFCPAPIQDFTCLHHEI